MLCAVALKFGVQQGAVTGLADAAKRKGSGKERRALVAGLAYGSEYGHFLMRKFVGTLLFTGYTGDIILGVEPDQDAKIKEGDKVLEYYKKRGVQAPVVIKKDGIPLAFTRFYDYKTWLEPYGDEDIILLTDTKDTYFQKHPFAEVADLLHKSEVDLMFFQEHKVTIGTQAHNSGWVRGCWGKVRHCV
jgi:hypothetical protein